MTLSLMFSTAQPARALRPWQMLALAVILVVATTRLLGASAWRGDLFGPWSPLQYQAATLGFNYFEFGFARRGLGGSIAHLLSDDILVATVLFHLLSATAVAGTALLLLRRLQAAPITQAVYAFVLLAMMLRWGEDPGRTDMAIAALLGGAAWALSRGRPVVACALLCLGLFIHENSFIFGMPLLAALVWRHGPSAFPKRAWGAAAAILAVPLAAYVATLSLPRPDLHSMAGMIRQKFEQPDVIVDWAIYFALSGARGVRTSICQNLTDPSYWVHPAGGLVVLVVATLALIRKPRSEWAAVAMAALPPFLFLSVVANDHARWAILASFNIWLVLVSTGKPGPSHLPGWMISAAAVAFLLLTHPKSSRVEYAIYAGSPLFEKVARRLGAARTPGIEEVLVRCDPTWQAVLEAPAR